MLLEAETKAAKSGKSFSYLLLIRGVNLKQIFCFVRSFVRSFGFKETGLLTTDSKNFLSSFHLLVRSIVNSSSQNPSSLSNPSTDLVH